MSYRPKARKNEAKVATFGYWSDVEKAKAAMKGSGVKYRITADTRYGGWEMFVPRSEAAGVSQRLQNVGISSSYINFGMGYW